MVADVLYATCSHAPWSLAVACHVLRPPLPATLALILWGFSLDALSGDQKNRKLLAQRIEKPANSSTRGPKKSKTAFSDLEKIAERLCLISKKFGNSFSGSRKFSERARQSLTTTYTPSGRQGTLRAALLASLPLAPVQPRGSLLAPITSGLPSTHNTEHGAAPDTGGIRQSNLQGDGVGGVPRRPQCRDALCNGPHGVIWAPTIGHLVHPPLLALYPIHRAALLPNCFHFLAV
jgi:hypothetical protein